MGVIQEINFTKDQENYSNDEGVLGDIKQPKIITFAYSGKEVLDEQSNQSTTITLFTFNPDHYSSINITFTASNPDEVELSGFTLIYRSTLQQHQYLSAYDPLSSIPPLAYVQSLSLITTDPLTSSTTIPFNPISPQIQHLLFYNPTTGITKCDIRIIEGTIIRGMATLM
jgi:hypothetical protein